MIKKYKEFMEFISERYDDHIIKTESEIDELYGKLDIEELCRMKPEYPSKQEKDSILYKNLYYNYPFLEDIDFYHYYDRPKTEDVAILKNNLYTLILAIDIENEYRDSYKIGIAAKINKNPDKIFFSEEWNDLTLKDCYNIIEDYYIRFFKKLGFVTDLPFKYEIN